VLDAAPPPSPPQAAIVVTGKALPESKAERAYDVVRITQKQIKADPQYAHVVVSQKR